MGQKPKCEAPLITDELLAYLDSIAPDRCPSIEQTDREIWIEAGRRALVRHLQLEAVHQRHEPLKKKP